MSNPDGEFHPDRSTSEMFTGARIIPSAEVIIIMEYDIRVDRGVHIPIKNVNTFLVRFWYWFFYVIKTNHVIRIKNTENCAITYHEKPCFIRFLYGFCTIFVRFSYDFKYDFHTIFIRFKYVFKYVFYMFFTVLM